MAFIDVDFPNDPHYVPGYTRHGKSVYRTCAKRAFGDSFAVLNEADRRDAANEMAKAGGGLSRLIYTILNQLQEGSCVGNMGAQALMVLIAKLLGKDRAPLMSAISLYKQIGSSSNSGASVEDCIDRMSDTGLLPLDTPENRKLFKHVMPATGFRTAYPTGWKDTASIFANVEGFWCDNVAEMETALAIGMCVGVGRAGHSILYLEPIYEGLTKFFDYVNSWGQWGFGKGDFSYGFGRDSSRLFNESADWCYAFQAADPAKWDWFTIGGTAA